MKKFVTIVLRGLVSISKDRTWAKENVPAASQRRAIKRGRTSLAGGKVMGSGAGVAGWCGVVWGAERGWEGGVVDWRSGRWGGGSSDMWFSLGWVSS